MKTLLTSTLFLFSSSFMMPANAAPFKFSIAQIPDTQSYFYHPGWADPGQITDMYQWVINDSKNNNYKYIFHVGDIIEMGGTLPAHSDEPETLWEWNTASQIFKTIQSNMAKAGAFIPYGFSVGNHDPRNATQLSSHDPEFGKGDFLPHTTLEVYKFLKSQYENSNNVHEYIPIPQSYPYSPSKFADPNFFISYRHDIVDGVNIIFLNTPYFMAQQAPSGAEAVNNFITKHQNDALVILNSHECGQALDVARGHKNVFMILCGHEPSAVRNDGSMDHIEVYQPTPPFRYRFDYQALWTGQPPTGSIYLPQHPLVRTYDFILDKDKGTLSWQANDIQPWGNTPKTFETNFQYNGGITKFAYDKNFKTKQGYSIWSQNPIFDSSKHAIGPIETIHYKEYLSPAPMMNKKIKNSEQPINAEFPQHHQKHR